MNLSDIINEIGSIANQTNNQGYISGLRTAQADLKNTVNDVVIGLHSLARFAEFDQDQAFGARVRVVADNLNELIKG